MYPPEFEYYEADSIEDTIALLAEHESRHTELLAGGHSLLPMMKSGLSSPDVVIDIGQIGSLNGVEVSDGVLEIGAATTYRDLLAIEEAWDHAPALLAAVEQVGDRQVRSRGTVGGNLAHADPASDLPAAVLASDATFVLQGPDGQRAVPATEFFQGMYATDVGQSELLTTVEVPSATGAIGTYAKKPSPSSGYPVVGVAALLSIDGETVTKARIGANGIVDHGVRLEPVEAALEGKTLDGATIESAAERAGDEIDRSMVLDDMEASPAFRVNVLEIYTERAINQVADRIAPPQASS